MAAHEIRKNLTAQEFALFRDWIHSHSGIFLEEAKMDSLRISLVTRATRRDIFDFRDYFDVLQADETEFKELMNLVTINETSFFRFPQQFSALKDRIIPEILAGRGDTAARRFRVWSAGCSTGEEPYTIGMTLLDSALAQMGYECQILGTDVSTQALERARSAVYPARALTNLSQHVVQRWFEPVTDGHRPIDAVRGMCDFHYHNLIKEPYPLAFMSGWDVIFCRNVTIYFKLESTKRVVDHFYDALNPGGYLFIGHSETLTSITDRFELVEIDGIFLHRKPLPKRALSFSETVMARTQQVAARTRAENGSSIVRGRRSGTAEPVRTYEARATGTSSPSAAGMVPVQRTSGPRPSSAPAGPPDASQLLVERAHELLENAQAPEALSLALEAIEHDPSNVDAHLVAAFSFADMGRLDEAMAQAQTALDQWPLTAGARYIMGVIHQQRGEMDEATSEFKRTLYIDSDFVLARFALANIHRARGEQADACREYENTIRLLEAGPTGQWTAFLGGFRPDLLAQVCQRSLLECGRDGRR